MILVTGATGYIGSHIVKKLKEFGYNHVCGIDTKVHNDCIKYLTHLTLGDIISYSSGKKYLAIIHCAGYISVEESMKNPSKYYTNNLMGTLNLLNLDCYNFIFASTAGAFDPISPYAKSKIAAEDCIKERAKNHTIFRFFNVAGSNGEFGQIGPSTHLIRIAAEAAAGKRDSVTIYGNDYDTPDGTCIRDYIHVDDLAEAVVRSVENPSNKNYECLGSGTGYSVLEVLNTMRATTQQYYEYNYGSRRIGDPDKLIVDDLSKYLTIKQDLITMCESAYEWERRESIR